jgi:hypothetical protein
MQVMFERTKPFVPIAGQIAGIRAGLSDIRAGLLLDVDFAENAGSRVFDQSGRHNHGTIVGAVRAHDRVYGGALRFDGIDDSANFGQVPDIRNISGSFTICALYKRAVKDTVNADAITGNWYWTSVGNNRRGGLLRYYINTDSLAFLVEVTNGVDIQELQASVTAASLNRWYFAAGVFDALTRKAKIYLDGVLQNTVTASTGFSQPRLDSPNDFMVGNNPTNNGYFPGSIALSRFYGRALDDGEIRNLYHFIRQSKGMYYRRNYAG